MAISWGIWKWDIDAKWKMISWWNCLMGMLMVRYNVHDHKLKEHVYGSSNFWMVQLHWFFSGLVYNHSWAPYPNSWLGLREHLVEKRTPCSPQKKLGAPVNFPLRPIHWSRNVPWELDWGNAPMAERFQKRCGNFNGFHHWQRRCLLEESESSSRKSVKQ